MRRYIKLMLNSHCNNNDDNNNNKNIKKKRKKKMMRLLGREPTSLGLISYHGIHYDANKR